MIVEIEIFFQSSLTRYLYPEILILHKAIFNGSEVIGNAIKLKKYEKLEKYVPNNSRKTLALKNYGNP